MASVDPKRLTSIDTLRGLVMVIMALDHVRDMLGAARSRTLDFADADAALFFTRWITHLCAPTFVLLAGTSAFLYGAQNRSKADLTRFLVSRGIWLVLVELSFVNFAWNLNLGPAFVPVLQVIWAIGVSMLGLAALVWLPRPAIAAFGVAMILGHNLLDGIEPAAEAASAAWVLLHVQGPLSIGGRPLAFVIYPLIPWIGVMALGYAIGPVFVGADPRRPRRLVGVGSLLILVFFAARLVNVYGEPSPWQPQAGLEAALIDFFDTTKYPPSLQFLLMTLGPACVLLGVLERAEGPLAASLATIGRVPFFFYVVHLYLIHLVALAVGVAQGFPVEQIAVLFVSYPPGFGVDLGAVYAFWIAIVLALYPACRWFA
ncbi:MAG: DUF1624 domain-containing protein, partial [Myxococcales bacterium]